ncbi:Pentatricopeptide repeat-containing protein [Striga hermonthica]|uniref:Pentatricopeptide repeat-containing protein n=1 Tax=Striga hermonthica TaxID=68872 RepID=A0A9N7MUS5_STRHE|nr:Pentatricopeptide repeat-containing protein [Striga hermonthica]
MAVFLFHSFVKFIPIRVSRVRLLPALNISICNRPPFSTQISPEESTDEILNQILACENNPSVSREEICINHIRRLCAAENLQAAVILPQKLRGKQIFLGPRVYNYLLEASVAKNDVEALSQVFRDLLVFSGSITLSSYLIVARALGKFDNPSVLLNFIKQVSELELPRIDIVLNRLIFALAKCGHVESALLIVDQMKSLKCEPDLVTYNMVLAILGRQGRVDDMLRLFELIKAAAGLAPDIVTYNTVLNCVRKMGRFDLCLFYFEEMSERGIQPDVVSYKALVESLGRSGHVEEALRAFDEMKCRGISPSVHIYQALIFSLKKSGRLELASKFSTEMNKLFPKPVVPRDFQFGKYK